MAGQRNIDTSAGVGDYVKLLAKYYKTMPSSSGSALRPTGVTVRGKLPNQSPIPKAHPSGRPPAEHIVRQLVQHITPVHYKPSVPHEVHIHAPSPKPAKRLVLKNVKAIHLSHPTIKKVSL